MTLDTLDTPKGQTETPISNMLLFKLSGEMFGIAVVCVNEILDPIKMTQVPNASEFVPAVINVRGSIVPLIDVRKRLLMPPQRPSPDIRFVVLELMIEDTLTKVAIAADEVSQVIDTAALNLERIPELGARWPRDFVNGVIRHGDNLVVILNSENLFRPDPANEKSV
ncbi:chemotaxis protein CheW [Roseobacter weihaiensis]|uniref:chemotaxis protein CheW n=1 Tax=Roseobacter weihaiensis TaxID=2763262 RepID=UPI001D0B2C14|nr:chemotaxis protein CheW [Roseobacter sp. H9]